MHQTDDRIWRSLRLRLTQETRETNDDQASALPEHAMSVGSGRPNVTG